MRRVLAGVLLAVLAGCDSSHSWGPQLTPGQTISMNDHYFGCTSEALLNEATTYAALKSDTKLTVMFDASECEVLSTIGRYKVLSVKQTDFEFIREGGAPARGLWAPIAAAQIPN